MAGTVNKVIILGNLGRDPEVRYAQNGNKFVNMSVATSDRWKDRQTGEQRERTEWHRVVIFNERLVDVAERYLRKGSTVYLEGQLQTRKWQDQNNQDRYTTEVVLGRFGGELQMVGGRGGGGEPGGPPPPGGPDDYGGGGGPQQGGGGGFAGGPSPSPEGGGSGWDTGGGGGDLDDDIPF